MPKCSVKKCRNSSVRNLKKDGISYFRFPKNEIEREKWRRIIANERCEEFYKPNDSSVVCSCHFLEHEMYYTKKGFRKVNKGASPSMEIGITTTQNVPPMATTLSSLGNEPSTSRVSDKSFESQMNFEVETLMKQPVHSAIITAPTSSLLTNKLDKGSDREESLTLQLKTEVNLISSNLRKTGWNNILCMGHWPDLFYHLTQFLHFTFAISNTMNEDYEIEDVVPYHSNVIVINCINYDDFEESLTKIINLPYWHPLANVILLFESLENNELLSKVFFVLWYYKVANAVITRFDDDKESLLLSYYNPYTYENFTLPYISGCYTTRKIGMPIESFRNGFTCEDSCYNVSLYSKLRANNLGTCISFDTQYVSYGDTKSIHKLHLFWPKGKNLHGFPLRAFTTEVKPFFIIEENGNDTYTLQARDGMLWRTMSSIMNFTIDLTSSKSVMKLPFNFELSTQQIFSFGHRKADLFLIPIYLLDLIIVELDQTFPMKDSGVCIAAHRAGFETILFDIKLVHNNSILMIKFILSFIGSWAVFSIFFYVEKQRISVDQLGKDLLNTVRNCLTISLHKPPKKGCFRIFLGFSLWSYFVLNFASQAAITSFFTAVKKGSEVETFEDVIEKGYIIEGMASPDIMLPETEEQFMQINSKLKAIQDIFTCVNRMKNDSKRFCLIDCAIAHYLEINELDHKGQQFLHIAKDRIHSRYLNMIFPRHSPMTEHFSKYMIALVEGGFIKKWEQSKYSDIKEEAPIKPLNLNDLLSIFKCYLFLIGISFIVLLMEIVFGYSKKSH